MKKRDFIKTSMVLGAGALLSAPLLNSCVNAQGGVTIASLVPHGDGGFLQAELSYAFDALEPNIDAQTMELHYGKHHAGYTKKFNAALVAAGIASTDIHEIFKNVSQHPAGVRNNGGGYFNHALYWSVMSPNGGGEPTGKLLDAINEAFGSVDEFKQLFSSAAATQFGSGWAWLLVDENGKLQVSASQNQDNPLMDISDVKGTPILNIDVWEHAYYLNYQNRRKEYITNFWNVVNWDFVSELYEGAV